MMFACQNYLFMGDQKMADIVRDHGTAHPAGLFQYDRVVRPLEPLIVALDGLDVMATSSELDRDLTIQHLVEQQPQWRSASCVLSQRRRSRSAASSLALICPSISSRYSAQ